MENGRWGHNSDFTEEQVHVPMVIWVPGKEAQQFTHITSHLDIPPTLLSIFGVTNPPEDYSLGYVMFGRLKREFAIVSGWDDLAYIDKEYKAVFPLESYGFFQQQVTTNDDMEVEDDSVFYDGHKTQLLQILKELGKFSRDTGHLGGVK